MLKYVDDNLSNGLNSYNGKLGSSSIGIDDETALDEKAIKQLYENENIKRIVLSECNFFYDDVNIDDELLQKTIFDFNSKIQEVENQEVKITNENTKLRNEIDLLTEKINISNKSKLAKEIDSKESLYKENTLFLKSLATKKSKLKNQKSKKLDEFKNQNDEERRIETIERIKKLSKDIEKVNELIDQVGILLVPMKHNFKTIQKAYYREHNRLFADLTLVYESKITAIREFQSNLQQVEHKLKHQFKG